MEGEGISGGSAGAPASAGSSVGSVSLGSGSFEVGSNAVESGFDSISAPSVSGQQIGATQISIFEAPGFDGSANKIGLGPVVGTDFNLEPVTVSDEQISRIETGVIDAVKDEGTPEAGFQFLADVPIVDNQDVLEGVSPEPASTELVEHVEGETPLEIDKPQPETQSTPEQKQVQNYVSANPDIASAMGNVITLSPDQLASMMLALKKILEEEQNKVENEQKEEKMSKKMMALLSLFLMVELMFKAAEKGAKEMAKA